MSNLLVSRLVGVPESPLRLEPPEPLPDSMIKRFPELRDWDQRNLEIWKRNVQEIGRQIAVARVVTTP